MAKKKKTQLKPIARGFATTSVPKKVSPPAEEPSPTFDEEGPKDDTKPASSETGNPVTVGEPDSTQVEQQALQAIVEKLQEKTEKEIIRMVKSIETERRCSKSLPTLELDPRVAQSIVEFVLNGPPSAATPLPGDSSKDLLLQRTGITYGTLRRLGFSEERVLECLRSTQGTEIEEAYEWLALHCSLDELEPDEQKSETPSSTTLSDNSIQSPPTPRTPSQFLIAPSTPTTPTTPPTPSRLDATAPVFHPSGSLRPSKPETQQLLKTGFPEGHTPDSPLPDDGSSGRSSPDTLDPTGRYVELKLRYDALRGKRDPRDLKNAALLESKLAELKSDYLFSQKEANALYEIKREKARSLALKKKLEGKEDVNTQHVLLRTMKPDLKPFALPPASEPSTEASDDEGLSEGMFAILEPLPETETTSQGKVVTINDLALPKHWSGRTPKTLLKDIVHKKDRYATISYALISGHSRAKRVSATIRWQNRLISEWQMEDAACHDEAQAEQYISTVALHALTFPLTEGFAAHPLPQAGQTFFRTFPPAFRDLWDELEAKRKERDEEINRSTWARLLALVEEKSLADEKVSKKSQKEVQSNQATSRAISTKSSDISEDVASLYEQRRTSIPYQEMLGHRNLLPIAAYRTQILATLQDSQILVLSGETGCGKSTQVPSFILEDQLSRGKHCKIYCTEPRRISAISLAQRVSQELGEPPSALGTANSLIGYSIRLESTTSRNTCLTFVTNGIALRMLEGGSGPGGQGTAFDEITHIIIDEVHERTIESDFLLIVLKSLLRQRPELRVILMSATVDAEKISDYFDKCPTFHVPGRTFPVNVNYLEDAVELTKWTISETSPFARRLHDKYYQGKARDWSEDAMTADDDGESIQENVKLEKRYSPETTATINLLDERLIPYDLIMRLLETICFGQQYSDYSPAILVFMPGLGEIRRLNDILTEHPAFGSIDTFRIYPLHSTLSSENQSAVFEVPPSGIRKIVIATNIAETGITIPDVTCVIDTGKHREMRFDEKRQISRLIETFIAKSNAAQRRGRAGRVREGICFHLFTRLRHDTQMADSPLPEMTRLSLADLALRIKIMRVNFGASIENVLSQALDPPTSINVQRAIGMLVEVRALTPSEDITPMGRLLSKLPTDVHLGKFLLIATVFRCLDPALTIAAALNSKSPFITPFGQEQEADRAKQAFRIENSDFLTIHNVFASWRQASVANPSFVRKFCRTNYLSHQNLQQIEDLRQQFLGYLVDSNFIQVDRTFVRDLSRARYGRNRARFVWPPQEYNTNGNNASLVHAALAAGLYPKILSVDRTSGQMKTISNNQLAFVHPSSANFGRKVADLGVNYLSYFTLMHSKRLYAWEIGPVDDAALILLCGECDFKLTTGSVMIDRKVKYKISTKANVALKMLRSHLAELLADHFRSKPLRESQLWWSEGAVKVLGKLDWEPKEQPSIIVS